MEEKKSNSLFRIIICIVLVLVIFVAFAARLFDWQVVHGKEYQELADKSTSYTEVSDTTRGEILDVDGKELAINKTSYNIVLNKIYMKDNETNDDILSLITLLKKCGDKWIDVLPISIDDEGYSFEKNYEADLEFIQSESMLNDDSLDDANKVMTALIERYDIDNKLSIIDKRNLASVRYNMEKKGYGYSTVYVFAEGVSEDTVAVVSERAQSVPGVEVRTHGERVIKNGTVAPHIVGIVGQMSEEELEEHKEDGYVLGDSIGKFGIEAGLEDELRGEAGEKIIEKDGDGNITKVTETVEAKPGNSVFLTINSRIQEVANYSLSKNVDRARSEGISECERAKYSTQKQKDRLGEDCYCGGAVMLDCRDNSVIAAASCPNYDISRYYDPDYNEWLYSDEHSPMYSRAFDGAFQPGSSYKPCTALAALQEGIITPSTTITCTQHYDYYDGFTINCLSNHGTNDLRNAIAKSCNYYFADVGRRLGITSMYLYSEKFGLGVKTGLEISESTGVLAGRDSETWYVGNTCQAAIGQSDNTFTVVQLATYTSTIANAGVRYRTHLVRKITSYDRKETILNNDPDKPEVVANAELSKGNVKAVKEGMRQVVASGTAASYVGGYPVAVAGKTGTAENAGSDHCVFICFAPYEKPEIAVAVVLEHGAKTKYAMYTAMDMMDAYFNGKTLAQVQKSSWG